MPTRLAIGANDDLCTTSKSGTRNGLICRVSPAKLISLFYAFGGSEFVVAIAVACDDSVVSAGEGALYCTIVRITPASRLSVHAAAAGEHGNVDGSGAGARFSGIGVDGERRLEPVHRFD